MQYYNSDISTKFPKLIEYFKNGITDENKNISHCLLFWGSDILSQCELALEISRILNCSKDKSTNCDCLNCKWIREQTHPAVKIYTRLDFKEATTSTSEDDEETKGKKNINIAQAKAIINELSITSDYHRVYIFCDRDEDGNLLPLNRINFPEATSNALLKTFEEPPQNTTFIFLTKDRSDVISTVVSRSQSFFIPHVLEQDYSYNLVEEFISNYWEIEPNQVLDFQAKLYKIASENEPKIVFEQIQNYMLSVIKSNCENKQLFYKILQDLNYVEESKRQLTLAKMILQIVVENLSYNLILGKQIDQ